MSGQVSDKSHGEDGRDGGWKAMGQYVFVRGRNIHVLWTDHYEAADSNHIRTCCCILEITITVSIGATPFQVGFVADQCCIARSMYRRQGAAAMPEAETCVPLGNKTCMMKRKETILSLTRNGHVQQGGCG